MAGQPVKRESPISRRAFPFELLHAEGPANNMPSFHWHDFMELSWVRRGSGVYEIEDKVFHVSRGDVVIINNCERHRVTYHPQAPLYETVFHFAPQLLCPREAEGLDAGYLRLFLYDGATFTNAPALPPAVRKEVGRLVAAIREEYSARRPWSELMIKARLLTLVTHLLRASGLSEQPDPRGVAARRRNVARLERILAHIRRGFASELSLGGIAARFDMNPSYFSDYFHRNLGITFSEHLARVRIQEALRLLAEDRQSVTQIALACGFNTPASFYRAFRRVTGGSPRDVRSGRVLNPIKR
jgi:AraC-like DNA-binding protein